MPDEIEPSLPSVPAIVVPPVVVPPVLLPPPIIIIPAPPTPTVDTAADSLRDPNLPENEPEAQLPLPGELQQNTPSQVEMGSDVPIPDTFRIGYSDYLRTAEVSQIIAAAVPGVAGIVLLTTAGGFVGYRQAKAGRAVRTIGTSRFLP